MTRTMITQAVLELIAEHMDKQDEKGKMKYGETLDTVPLDSYNWNTMAIEELVDCIKYIMMENIRLRNALRSRPIWTNDGEL